MPRVVFDCNIFLQALSKPNGPSGRCVQATFGGEVDLFISPQVIDEVRDVAFRPKVIAKLRFDVAKVEQFLKSLIATATLINDVPQRFISQRDPDDAHYVNLAMAIQASFVVSRDRDLLDLMSTENVESESLRRMAPNLRILNPVAFLRENKID